MPSTFTIYAIILMGLVSVGIAVWYTGRPAKNGQDMLLRLTVFCLTCFVAVWVIDAVLAYKSDLMTPDERKEMFGTIKDTMALLLAFYFGRETGKKEKD